MQIKTNQSTKKKSNTDLVRRWLEMTLPPITGFIVLPYLFLFLGSLYAEEFHSIPAQTFLNIIVVQGILVITTPIVTAWITLKRVSKQLQTLAQVISQSAEKIAETTFVTDHWATLEKQHDDVGLAARQVKAAFLRNGENENTDQAVDQLSEDAESNYSSLFSLNMSESNPQIY